VTSSASPSGTVDLDVWAVVAAAAGASTVPARALNDPKAPANAIANPDAPIHDKNMGCFIFTVQPLIRVLSTDPAIDRPGVRVWGRYQRYAVRRP
jgi:hypothetical protein